MIRPRPGLRSTWVIRPVPVLIGPLHQGLPPGVEVATLPARVEHGHARDSCPQDPADTCISTALQTRVSPLPRRRVCILVHRTVLHVPACSFPSIPLRRASRSLAIAPSLVTVLASVSPSPGCCLQLWVCRSHNSRHAFYSARLHAVPEPQPLLEKGGGEGEGRGGYVRCSRPPARG